MKESVRCPKCDSVQGIRVRLAHLEGRLVVVSRCEGCAHEWVVGDRRLSGADGGQEGSDPQRDRDE
jgi:hypothetical protein